MKVFTNSFVNNKFVSNSGAFHKISSPYDESEIAKISLASLEDLNAAVRGAWEAFRTWSAPSYIDARSRVLAEIAKKLRQKERDFAALESISGKPVSESISDVRDSAACFEYYSRLLIDHRSQFSASLENSPKLSIAPSSINIHGAVIGNRLRNGAKPEKLASFKVREPLGVCGLLTPFNYPLLVTSWKLAPALAAGNTALLKPAPDTPFSSLLLAQAVSEIDSVPKGTLQVLLGGATLGSQITEHPDISHVSFTGSTRVGRSILHASASSNLKPVTLELGGKAPLVVTESGYNASRTDAIETVFGAAFSNMGQNCCAATKLYLERSIHEQFLADLKARIAQVRPGNPAVESTNWGPLANRDAFEKVIDIIEQTKADNESCLFAGGKRLGDKGYVIEPTIFTKVAESSMLAQREIFGPVLSVMEPFSDLAQCISQINTNAVYGLASGIITGKLEEADLFVKNISAGVVWVNTYNITPPDVPFGGRNLSGSGVELGIESLHSFSRIKAVTSNFS